MATTSLTCKFSTQLQYVNDVFHSSKEYILPVLFMHGVMASDVICGYSNLHPI